MPKFQPSPAFSMSPLPAAASRASHTPLPATSSSLSPDSGVDSLGNTILQVKDLAKQFTRHEQHKVLPGALPISFTVNQGELAALTGPSGAGKSSLLKCVYRTYLPSDGEIAYRTRQGQWIDLATASDHHILHLRRHEIGFVTQFLHFLPRQTTVDVIAKPLFDLGIERQVARDRAITLLDHMQLPERLWHISPATFSGGEKQRVNLARSMVLTPRLLLLDEPTASLDQGAAERVVELIHRIKASGTAMLAIFHDPDIITALADHTITVHPA